jgi:hypothetical protein
MTYPDGTSRQAAKNAAMAQLVGLTFVGIVKFRCTLIFIESPCLCYSDVLVQAITNATEHKELEKGDLLCCLLG